MAGFLALAESGGRTVNTGKLQGVFPRIGAAADRPCKHLDFINDGIQYLVNLTIWVQPRDGDKISRDILPFIQWWHLRSCVLCEADADIGWRAVYIVGRSLVYHRAPGYIN